jgi:glutathione S-transferase|tara:strand:+ start:1176 stop:1754 length:579 start_codon:yes stop_codon:yes gene_type:complete
MCHELGLDYTAKLIGPRTGETHTEAFLSINPKGKIPVLIDDDLVLSEGAAIITYLADTYAKPGTLIPVHGGHDRARYNQWQSFIQMELDAHTLYVIRKHRDLQHLYGEAPAAIEAAIAGFNKQVAVASEHLRHNEYLVGGFFTGADLMLAGILQWAKDYGFDLDPTLLDYTNRQHQRPAYITANRLNKSTVP